MAESNEEMRVLLQKFSSALPSFASSPDTFRILSSIPSSHFPSSHPQASLYVLDASFNPPTLAHQRMAVSALTSSPYPSQSRLLLLLATQNADKAPKPASFEQRLAMMTILASDIRRAFSSTSQSRSTFVSTPEAPVVDIGITKLPYFHSKAVAISSSSLYPSNPTQIHLTGFDTLIRILDPKYYPPEHTLAPLEPFLSKHRLRVTYRTGSNWGDREDQMRVLKELGEGRKDDVKAKREWANRIELVDGRSEGDVVVSSTAVRNAIRSGDSATLKQLVSDGIGKWVLEEGLYLEDV